MKDSFESSHYHNKFLVSNGKIEGIDYVAYGSKIMNAYNGHHRSNIVRILLLGHGMIFILYYMLYCTTSFWLFFPILIHL